MITQKIQKDDESSAWGKAVSVIHASPPEILAFLWCYCSYLRMKTHIRTQGKLPRKVYSPEESSSCESRTQYVVVQKYMPVPYKPRESNLRFVWGEVEENNKCDDPEYKKTLALAFEPADVEYQFGEYINHTKSVFAGFSKKFKTNSKSSSSSIFSKLKVSISPTISEENREAKKRGVAKLKEKGVWLITPLASDVSDVTFVTNIIDNGNVSGKLATFLSH